MLPMQLCIDSEICTYLALAAHYNSYDATNVKNVVKFCVPTCPFCWPSDNFLYIKGVEFVTGFLML